MGMGDTVWRVLSQYNGYNIYIRYFLNAQHLRPLGNAYNKKGPTPPNYFKEKAMYTMGIVFSITLCFPKKWPKTKKTKGVLVTARLSFSKERKADFL